MASSSSFFNTNVVPAAYQQTYTGPTGPQGPLAGTRTTAASTSGSFTCDWYSLDLYRLTLTGATTLVMQGALDGQKLIIEVIQGGSGGYALTMPANVRFPSDIPVLGLSTTLGSKAKVGLIYNSADSKYDVVAVVKGF